MLSERLVAQLRDHGALDPEDVSHGEVRCHEQHEDEEEDDRAEELRAVCALGGLHRRVVGVGPGAVVVAVFDRLDRRRHAVVVVQVRKADLTSNTILLELDGDT